MATGLTSQPTSGRQVWSISEVATYCVPQEGEGDQPGQPGPPTPTSTEIDKKTQTTSDKSSLGILSSNLRACAGLKKNNILKLFEQNKPEFDLIRKINQLIQSDHQSMVANSNVAPGWRINPNIHLDKYKYSDFCN